MNPRVKHPNWLPKEEFDAIYARVSRLSVDLLIRTPKGVILTKRTLKTIPAFGQWHTPGGTVLFGESLHDTAKRVALDELGIKIKVGELVGYIEYPLMSKAGYKGWPVSIVFEAKITEGTPTGSYQAEEVGYFNEVPENTLPDQANFLKKVL